MKHLIKRSFVVAATGLTLLGSHAAHAQREAPTRADRRAERQQANETLTPEQQQANRAARMQERMKSMTPEQRAQVQARIAEFQQKMTDAGIDPNAPDALQKARDAGLLNGLGGGQAGNGRGGARAAANGMKQIMESAGIVDFDTQEAIIAYVAEQNKARLTLLDLAKKAGAALQVPVVQTVDAQPGGKDAADATVVETFGAYQAAVDAENVRQETALKALDEKIHYTTKPRLRAFLTLVGILDNDVLAIGGPAAVFAPATDVKASQTQVAADTRG